MTRTYAVGIDLGTSNCAIAVSRITTPTTPGDPKASEILEIAQIADAHSIEQRNTLPSAIYLPTKEEYSSGEFRLPWEDQSISPSFVSGFYARERGAETPERLVTSAKSWLCNPRIDRRSSVLPWQSSISQGKMSPLEASTRFLEHLREALLDSLSKKEAREVNLQECAISITVPASFDEVARTLTVEAATHAGFSDISLLEEPQAAFYDWIASHGSSWRTEVTPGELVLVCDVGGGTADFSLIAVTESDGNLDLQRVSVGRHILLGGDNMDLALAYHATSKITESGGSLDSWQSNVLVHLCRSAKETLLSDQSIDSVPISLPSRGADLFAEPLSTTLTREEVQGIVADGFFPSVASNAQPARPRSSGLKQMGLPYAADAALTRHLAQFLQHSLHLVEQDETLAAVQHHIRDHLIAPTAVLFNGGVFNASVFRERIQALLTEWRGEAVRELTGTDRDLAVAKGAAVYAEQNIVGRSFRIRSGVSRSYYVGIESAAPAVPGITPPVNGLCVVPLGTEEGASLSIHDAEFGLVVGEEVEFRLFFSEQRPQDETGTVIENADKVLSENAPLLMALDSQDGETGAIVPVTLHAEITDVGIMELWMHHTESERKWKLEYNIRPENMDTESSYEETAP